MRTGELWAVDLGTPVDPETGSHRPALVVSPPRFTGPLRMVCPLTSTRRDHPWRIEVEADGHNGLDHASYVQTEHLRSIPVARGARRVGALDALTMMRVRRTLTLLLDLP